MMRTILLLVSMTLALVVVSGVAWAADFNCGGNPCYGTADSDLIGGTSSGDNIYALAGDDDVFAFGGDDTISGGLGRDHLRGEEGSDYVYGGKGGDTIDADTLDTSGSVDHSYGGVGTDVIKAQDGNKDIIDCGSDSDMAIYDQNLDEVKNCEIRNPRGM